MPEQDLLDAIVDAQRMITRVGEGVARVQEAVGQARPGADLALLVELFALYGDAAACAATSRSKRESAAFGALADGLERLLAGRGAALVRPQPGDAFDPAAMQAVEVVEVDDAALDRTVERVLAAGLRLVESGRGVRPARVVVRRGSSQVPPRQ